MSTGNGISPVIATVIIVAVAIALAIAFAFWISGLLSATGYGTRPIKLAIYSDLELYGEYFVVLIKNLGSDTVYIDKLFIDGKPVSYIFDAQTYPTPGEARWFYESGGGIVIYINPGETVQVKGVIKNISLEPGVTHQLSIHTTLGLEFHRELNAKVVSPVAFPSGGVVAYDTGLKDPNDPDKRIILIFLKMENQWQDNLEIYKVEFYNPETREKLGEQEIDPPITIAPGSCWEPTRLTDLIKVSFNPGEYIVNVTWRCGERGGGLASFIAVSSEVVKAYVIYITEDDEDPSDVINERYPAWYRDPQPVFNELSKFFEVIHISKMSQLKDFIEDPLDGPFIVINIHSESFPIPKEYIDNAPGGDLNSKVAAAVQEWYGKVKDAVSGHMWVWVHPCGYPFWGTANKRYARSTPCNPSDTAVSWTDSWGYDYINWWSNLNRCTGGARGASVGRNGAVWAGLEGFSGNGAHNDLIGGTEYIDEINKFFGVNLPKETYGWATVDVSSECGSQNYTSRIIVYYRDIDSGAISSDYFDPIIYSIGIGNGYYVIVSLARPQWWPGGAPANYDELAAQLTVYTAIHTYIY
ncbi:MAG: hypothetical protein DRJ32_06560, partial [Thermoprotei archaeon]